jgi:cytoskeletal protein CcmA (bactofilin family)
MFNKTNSSPSMTSSSPEMAAKKSASAVRSSAAPSILGSDLIITGDIKTDGDIQIDGRLDGNIKAGNVTIGEQGAVNGKISADAVHIRGKITGKVDATTVDLAETANVQADLIQDKLMIANGAFFDGKCTRKTPAPGAAKKPKKTA